MKKRKDYPFHSSIEEVESRRKDRRFKLAFMDEDFILREDIRSVRLLLEYKKAEVIFNEKKIHSTVVICGSSRTLSKEAAQEEYDNAKSYLARCPKDPSAQKDLQKAKVKLEMSQYYEASRELAIRISSSKRARKEGEFVILTGGGPGVMEAANRGSLENNAKSLGLSIFLPTEEDPNEYIPEELHIHFHYFAMRKMHFLTRARAVVFFPGGYGTLDELFETLTLIQTKKLKPIPLILFGQAYWEKLINFSVLVDMDMIAPEDLSYFKYVETVEEAWKEIKEFYQFEEM